MGRRRVNKKYVYVPGFIRCAVCGFATLCVVDDRTNKVVEVPTGWVHQEDNTWICDTCARELKTKSVKP